MNSTDHTESSGESEQKRNAYSAYRKNLNERQCRRDAKDDARGDVIFYRLLGPVDSGIGPRQEDLRVVTLSGPITSVVR